MCIRDRLKGYIKESTSAKLGSVFMKGAFGKLKKKMDYKEYGGALLLGLAGGVMKAHGSSDATAVFPVSYTHLDVYKRQVW